MRTKVLIFIDWFSPGFKAGGPTTSNVNLVEQLKDYFDFYIVTSNTDYHEIKPYSDVISNQWVKQDGFYVYYFSYDKLSFNSLRRVVIESGCKIWYINGVYSRYFSIYPLLLSKFVDTNRVIISARGMLSPHALAIKKIYKKSYLFFAKFMGLFRNVIFHATNDEEAVYIRKALGLNCIVFSIANLPKKINFQLFVSDKYSHKVRLVSFARISPEKNTLFAIHCLKYCKENVIYHIYGQINSQSYWNECKEAIKMLPNNVIVEYKGTASPKEIPMIYRNYHFLYLPSTGENFGHAILESFMNSSPVIISDRTPWKDLHEKKIGWDLSLDGGFQKFASVIDECALLSREEYEIMSKEAYMYALSICNSPIVKHDYIKMFSYEY